MRTASFHTPPAPAAHAGSPYHLLGRTPRYRWWRPLWAMVLAAVLALLTVNVMYLVATALAAASGVTVDLSAFSKNLGFADPWWAFVVSFAGIAVAMPAILLGVRWGERRPAGTLSSVRGGLRWGWLLECVLWALVGIVVVGAVETAGTGTGKLTPPAPATLLVVLALGLVIVPIQAAVEEYVFRGLLVQTFASWLRTPWPGVAVSALLFVSGHGYDDPLAVAGVATFAVAFSWLTIRTGGLEAAIALHALNNLASYVMAAVAGRPSTEQSGDYSLWQTVPTLLLTVAYALWISWRARRRGIATTSG